MSIHIEGRKYFDKVNGNTYHSVRIFENGEQIFHHGMTYGYGDQYLQTAIDGLEKLGKIPANPEGLGMTRLLREIVKASWSAVNVSRQKEL